MEDLAQAKKVLSRVRVKDLDFKNNTITFHQHRNRVCIHLDKVKMDSLKTVCAGKKKNDFIFKEEFAFDGGLFFSIGHFRHDDNIALTLMAFILHFI